MANWRAGTSDTMNAQLHFEESRLDVVVERLMDRHGAWQMVRAIASVLVLKRRQNVRLPHDLSDHVRRDIGLHRESRAPNYWDLR